MVREQGRYVKKASAGKEFAQEIPSVLPQGEAGLSGVSEFGILCFFFPILHSAFYIPHLGRPPGPRNEGRLMVFARNALASGPGNACNSIHLSPTCRKVKVGKGCPRDHPYRYVETRVGK